MHVIYFLLIHHKAQVNTCGIRNANQKWDFFNHCNLAFWPNWLAQLTYTIICMFTNIIKKIHIYKYVTKTNTEKTLFDQ